MSLTKDERMAVMAQVKDTKCPVCGDELVARDDGHTPVTQWGIPGAYVDCDNCGFELHKDQKDASA